ncbi:hypothetical protein, partial [Psychrobacter celer]
FGYQGIHNIVRQWLTPDIHALEGCGFTALDDKIKPLSFTYDLLLKVHNTSISITLRKSLGLILRITIYYLTEIVVLYYNGVIMLQINQ